MCRVFRPALRPLLFTLAGALVGAAGAPSIAETLTVAPGVVVISDDDDCSLREAIHNAEADAQVDNDDCPAGDGSDIIELAEGSVYTLVEASSESVDDGLTPITTTIEIRGNGATIERDDSLECILDDTRTDSEFRLMMVASPGDLTVSDLTLRNGCADGGGLPGDDGGAVFVDDANLTLIRVSVVDNQAQDVGGGLFGEDGSIEVFDSTLSGNVALRASGAVSVGTSATLLTIVSSTIVGNSSPGTDGAGGIGNLGTVRIVSSTISGNTTTGVGGGGIGNEGDVTLEASTVTGNSATGVLGGGGVGNAGTMTIKNSIVADNGAGGDCANIGTFNAVGDNLNTDGSCTGLDSDFSTVTSVELALGALADYGGPTETHALAAASVAIDAVADCTFVDSSPDTEDQRGIARPFGDHCDIGAYERSDVDGDGVEGGVDNCPDDGNADQADGDDDGNGDACDLCDGDDATGDGDMDGVCFDRDCDDTDGLGIVCLFVDGFESGDVLGWSSAVP